MAHHVHLAQIREVRALSRKFMGQRGGFNVAAGKGECASPLSPFFPKQRLIKYQTRGP
jgi:hypothetical protein